MDIFKQLKLRKKQEEARQRYLILTQVAGFIMNNPDHFTQEEIEDILNQMRECENVF